MGIKRVNKLRVLLFIHIYCANTTDRVGQHGRTRSQAAVGASTAPVYPRTWSH